MLLLIVLMVIGCGKEKQRVTHKYEVLLSTKDTMYVDAYDYESSTSTFTSKRTARFYDTHFRNILTINDPIYIREIK